MFPSTQPPLISVVIPAYNAARYLAETLQSVFAQTYAPCEIILIDDGSVDDTAAIAAHYAMLSPCPMRITHQVNGGISATRNRGIALAQGDTIAFLDADDRWLPDTLERQGAALAQSSDALIFGYVRQFISPEQSEAEKARIICPPDPQPGYLPGAMLTTKSVFERVGGFGAWRSGEFIDWVLRACALGIPTVMHPEVVMERRLHLASYTAQYKDTRTDYARVLKAALDRKRALASMTPSTPTE